MATEIETFPEHSPLGGSSAERWMECPGSNVLLQGLDLPPSDESDFAAEGTCAHDAAAHCLQKKLDAWEVVGQEFHGRIVPPEMAEHIQFYMDEINKIKASHRLVLAEVVEHRISADWNKRFYGKCDHAIIGEEWLDVTDLKYGEGIAVDATNNPQLKYYAVGILEQFMGPEKVRLRIIQPRAFHADGPVRVWETTRTELIEWRDKVLIPAMQRAEMDGYLKPGDWCRFCPAKIVCPALSSVFRAAASADAHALKNVTNQSLAADFRMIECVKHYIKALEAEVYSRLTRGEEVNDGTGEPAGDFGLVPKKANRVFTVEGQKLAREMFGVDALTEPELKSPAQIAALSDAAKKFVKEFAYTPQTGLTLACADDKRARVKAQKPADAFSHVKPD